MLVKQTVTIQVKSIFEWTSAFIRFMEIYPPTPPREVTGTAPLHGDHTFCIPEMARLWVVSI
jgi:hypothetical protein